MTHRNLSRRRFLSTSAAAGSSLLILGTRVSGNVIGANDRVRMGVAGLNGRGQVAISPLHTKGRMYSGLPGDRCGIIPALPWNPRFR